MTDKQLPPDWALAQALREIGGRKKTAQSASIRRAFERARELSAQQPVPRDEELPGMWERADLIGGATDFEPHQPDEFPPGHIDQVVDFLKAAPVASEADEVPMIFDLASAIESIPEPRDLNQGWRDSEIWEWALREAAKLVRQASKQPEQPARDVAMAWTEEDMQKPWGAEVAALRHLADDPALSAEQSAILRHCAKRIEATATLTTVEPAVVERFRIACRAWVRERVCYVEDVETLADVLRVLESVTQPPQQADGEAVAVVGEEWNPIRTSKRLVAIFNKKVPLGAKLYLHPSRGVEVTDGYDPNELLRAARHLIGGLMGGGKTDSGDLVLVDRIDQHLAALSGVQT